MTTETTNTGATLTKTATAVAVTQAAKRALAACEAEPSPGEEQPRPNMYEPMTPGDCKFWKEVKELEKKSTEKGIVWRDAAGNLCYTFPAPGKKLPPPARGNRPEGEFGGAHWVPDEDVSGMPTPDLSKPMTPKEGAFWLAEESRRKKEQAQKLPSQRAGVIGGRRMEDADADADGDAGRRTPDTAKDAGRREGTGKGRKGAWKGRAEMTPARAREINSAVNGWLAKASKQAKVAAGDGVGGHTPLRAGGAAGAVSFGVRWDDAGLPGYDLGELVRAQWCLKREAREGKFPSGFIMSDAAIAALVAMRELPQGAPLLVAGGRALAVGACA